MTGAGAVPGKPRDRESLTRSSDLTPEEASQRLAVRSPPSAPFSPTLKWGRNWDRLQKDAADLGRKFNFSDKLNLQSRTLLLLSK